MTQLYEVWDDATANRLGEFETVDEARAVLSAVLRDNGPEAASMLSVLSYTRADTGSEDYDVVTVLEGADFVAQLADRPVRSTP